MTSDLKRGEPLQGFRQTGKDRVVGDTDRCRGGKAVRKCSLIIDRSIADPVQTAPRWPSGESQRFSGEVEGLVVSAPSGASTSQSSRNSAAPRISGHAR
jgi:hypothetical protein